MPNEKLPPDAGIDLVLEGVDYLRDELTKLRSTVDHYCPAERRDRVKTALEMADLGLSEVALRVQGR